MTSFEKLCTDESLMLWLGHLGFLQYIEGKRYNFGVKMFKLCDAETNYVLHFIIYTGVDTIRT